MKKVLLLLFPLLLLTSTVSAQVLWEKTWGGPYDDACEVHATRDGGIILVASYGFDSWILKLDGNGDTSWTKRISLPLDFCSIVESDDGSFLTTGTTRYPQRDIVAWKLNSHGDSIWTRTYRDTTSSQGMYVVRKRAGNSFLITGYTTDNGYDMLAMKIDSLGNVQWRKTYGTPGFEAGAMPSPTSDGGNVFATTSGPSATTFIWVVRTDSLGDTLWARQYPQSLPTGGAIPLVANDGRILVIGWIDNGGNYDNHLMCLDSLGNQLWVKNYPGIGFEGRTAKGIIEDRFGGFTFVSSVDHGYAPGVDRDIALFRLDSLGNVMRIHRVGHAEDDMPRYFAQGNNGDYFLAGWSESFTPSGQQTYLARLSPNGCGEFFYQLAAPLYDSICIGDTTYLDAGSGYLSYLWNDGDTSQIRPVTLGDTFSVTVTDTNGCTNYSNAVIISSQEGPSFTWVVNGPRQINFDGVSGSSSAPMNWDFGDFTTGTGEDPIHTFPAQADYIVCVSQDIPGCGIETFCDTVFALDISAVSNANIEGISVYPNPARDFFKVKNELNFPVDCQLVDAQGRLVNTFNIHFNQATTISTSSITSGIYHLQFIQDKNWIGAQKIVIQH